ncbi:hypothetical protein, conserved [Eimeria tenella]|uniref:Obg domain-containing protein n=1 Tax=Eimeria tenella TaxID=5802 RepID=U6KN31_EIMTE|nr:hypothetical protein, conserved [Eimeria tenella]CDJ39497.1 hypothetical protein, conserved [Eimeria tenella]|eukprot:XP_013230252.1 hypothetical protein, conserved [Eimeria tenella]
MCEVWQQTKISDLSEMMRNGSLLFAWGLSRGVVSFSATTASVPGSRRLLEQPLKKLTQGDSGPRAEAREAAAAAAIVCTPVTVEGGSGGDGSIAFLRLKAAPRSGAAGGCGGRGGCVLLRAVGPLDESSGGLRRFTSLLESGSWRAASGATGAGQGKTGASGSDLLLGLPPNALVVDVSPLQTLAAVAMRRLLQQQQSDHEIIEAEQLKEEHRQLQEEQSRPLCCTYFAAPGETLVAARGGSGGRGNSAFVSNNNRHPLLSETGSPGEKRKLLVMHDFADFIVVGRMQSGKSTLLRALTSAAADTAPAEAMDSVGAATDASVAVGETAGSNSIAVTAEQGEHVLLDKATMQQQQQRQLQWLSAAVPDDVWLPTTEPAICIIPAPSEQMEAEQCGTDIQQQQQQGKRGLGDALQQAMELASAAPVVALDTPGLLTPAVSSDSEQAATYSESKWPPAAGQQDDPLKGLSAATAVVLVIDGSVPNPAGEFMMLHQEMLQANPQLSELPVILVLNKIDLRRQEQQEQGPSHDAELVESVRRQTGIKEVYAVSALRGDGCRGLLEALRRIAGLEAISPKQQQQLLLHFQQQQEQPQQEQQQQQLKQIDPAAYHLAFFAAYSAAAASARRHMLLFSVRELQQQQQNPGADLVQRPASAPPQRVSSISSKKHVYPCFPVLDDPYKWTLVELEGHGTLQRLLQSREVLHASPDFAGEDSISGRRCFELRGPLVPLLTEPVKFSSEAAKLRLYRQLNALDIIERAYTDVGANVGDYLLVGPVLLQLLPLLRHSRGRKRDYHHKFWCGDTLDILKKDGIPINICVVFKMLHRSAQAFDRIAQLTLMPSTDAVACVVGSLRQLAPEQCQHLVKRMMFSRQYTSTANPGHFVGIKVANFKRYVPVRIKFIK